ncbi:FRG domain-containing protein [Methanococcus sp. CF]
MALEIEINSISELLDYLTDIDELSQLLYLIQSERRHEFPDKDEVEVIGLNSKLEKLVDLKKSILNKTCKDLEKSKKNFEEQYTQIINECFYETEGFVVYRGQEDEKFKLNPSLFRKKSKDDNYDCKTRELDLYDSLIEHNHPDFKKQNDVFDRLALMQHYGIPTRLLDWTKNPLVALYFATEKVSKKSKTEKNGKVFAYSPKLENILHSTDEEVKIICDIHINNKNFKINEILKIRFYGGNLIGTDELFDVNIGGKNLNDIIKKNDKNEILRLIGGVFLIIPVLSNDRLRIQHGCFSMHGFDVDILDNSYYNVEKPTSYKLENSDEILATFIIPADKKEKIRKELSKLNIHAGTVFPELDKYGEYLKKKYSN